jgi:3D (Asp-Asp-Asp) domain-containing protein
MSRGIRFASALFLLCLCVSACGRMQGFHLAAVPGNYESLGEFAPTFYRTLDESAGEWPEEERTEELRTGEGELIARVTPTFKERLDIEGSARLRDGRVVNFDEKTDGRWTYLVAEGTQYGLDARGRGLVPFRTLAVDPSVVPLGTVVYVPALDGVRLPSGETHDGLCLAQDTGQGIEGRRVDIFVGFENDEDNTLTRSGRVRDMEPLRVYRVDDETARRFLARLK